MAAQAEVVDLLSSEDENSTPNVGKKHFSLSTEWNTTKKRVKREGGRDVIFLDFSDDEDEADDVFFTAAASMKPLSAVARKGDDDDDILEVAPPAVVPAANAGKSDKSEGQEEDVAIIGATGPNALADFPHSRENCVTHPHAQDPARHCPNCYCYVCDSLASSCSLWETHCHAIHGSSKWRKMREEVRRNGGLFVPSQRSWTSTTVMNLPSPPPLNVSARPDLTEYSLGALLRAITSVHPVESTPPPTVFTTNLRHYQKQSVAFMREEERRLRTNDEIRGGWLCDELGMGKSAVVLALIAANPLPADNCPSPDHIRSFLYRNPTNG